jgi:hypothetical protein
MMTAKPTNLPAESARVRATARLAECAQAAIDNRHMMARRGIDKPPTLLREQTR